MAPPATTKISHVIAITDDETFVIAPKESEDDDAVVSIRNIVSLDANSSATKLLRTIFGYRMACAYALTVIRINIIIIEFLLMPMPSLLVEDNTPAREAIPSMTDRSSI